MFRWAREQRDFAVEEVAKRLNTRAGNVLSWETGDGSPTIRQARQLAEFYSRSFTEFFLPSPPELPADPSLPDFRRKRGEPKDRLSRELRDSLYWAQAMRENALDLYQTLGEMPPRFGSELFCNLDSNSDQAANAARDMIGPPFPAQTSGSALDFPKSIRAALESAGILVLKDTQISKEGVRGYCIFASPLPVIVFGAESPAAQAFTMAHEMAHVLLRESGISGAPSTGDSLSHQSRVESWCDQFAGSYLIPADRMINYWAKPNSAQAAVEDDLLQTLAKSFRVSKHAMLIRLVHLGYVSPDYYWNVKREEFIKEEAEYKAFGRTKYYGSRFRSRCGDLYTGLVLEAWATGNITNHSAAELMGIKSFKHLDDIRREFSNS